MNAICPPVRPPAVAGLFYPDDPRALRDCVERYLAMADPLNIVPRAVIAPHAGFIYSGPVAANAFAGLAGRGGSIDRVVLLGPSHFVPLHGLALPGAEAFRTPLGEVLLDQAACERLRQLPQIRIVPAAHAREHSLEVELPFLQSVLGRFRLVPLAVGDASPAAVAEVLDLLWDERSLVVISTDLSHYHHYELARRIDAETSAAIEAFEYERIGPEHACGCRGLAGLLALARRGGHALTRLDLRNSGDTAGDRNRVVGYGAWVLH